MKITGRQEQDYIIAILHFLQQMYDEEQKKMHKVKIQKKPQWFPFDPSFIIKDWDTKRNMHLDLSSASITKWPANLQESFGNFNPQAFRAIKPLLFNPFTIHNIFWNPRLHKNLSECQHQKY